MYIGNPICMRMLKTTYTHLNAWIRQTYEANKITILAADHISF